MADNPKKEEHKEAEEPSLWPVPAAGSGIPPNPPHTGKARTEDATTRVSFSHEDAQSLETQCQCGANVDHRGLPGSHVRNQHRFLWVKQSEEILGAQRPVCKFSRTGKELKETREKLDQAKDDQETARKKADKRDKKPEER